MNTAINTKKSNKILTKETASENQKQVYIPAAILFSEALEAVAGACEPFPAGKSNTGTCPSAVVLSS